MAMKNNCKRAEISREGDSIASRCIRTNEYIYIIYSCVRLPSVASGILSFQNANTLPLMIKINTLHSLVASNNQRNTTQHKSSRLNTTVMIVNWIKHNINILKTINLSMCWWQKLVPLIVYMILLWFIYLFAVFTQFINFETRRGWVKERKKVIQFDA